MRKESILDLTPLGHIGAIDQHSFLQLLIEGPRDKIVTFIKVNNFGIDKKIPEISLEFNEQNDFLNGHTLQELLNSECDATYESIKNQNIPADMIVLDDVNYSTG